MTEDELAAVAIALATSHPERSEATSTESISPWLDAARREAIGLD